MSGDGLQSRRPKLDGTEDHEALLARLRRMGDHVIAELEKQRVELEAAGADVDAKIAGIRKLVPHYAQWLKRDEEAMEATLQKAADMADRYTELTTRLHVALDGWEQAIDRAGKNQGTLARVEAWEAYQMWKAANRELCLRWMGDYDDAAWKSQLQALIDELESR